MKLLFVTYHFPPDYGGIQKVMFDLVKGLKKGNQITVIAPYSNKKYSNKGYQLLRSPFKNKLLEILWFNFIYIKLKDDYDIIIGSTWKSIATIIIGYLRTKCKSIYIAHGADITRDANNLLLNKIHSIINKKITRIVAVSNYTKKKIGKEYSSKVKVIHNGINTSAKQYKSINKNDKFIITTVAQLEPRKGHLEYLELFPNLIKQIDDIRYDIIGNGVKYNDIKEKIRKYKLTEYVKLIGSVNDEKLKSYYSNTDVFLLPNITKEEGRDFEGFGIVLLEASMYKLPVIAGSEGGTRDIIKHGYNGFLFDENNMEDINNFIIKLYNNQELQKEMGNNAYKLAFDFDKKIMIEEYKRLLFEVTTGTSN